MKIKKLLSLMLCLAMLMSVVLTGCGENKTTDDEATDEATDATEEETAGSALSMYIVTDDATTEEQAKAVQLAINEITLKKLDVKVKINFIKESEYWETIEEALQAVDDYEVIKLMESSKKKKLQRAVDSAAKSLEEAQAKLDEATTDEEREKAEEALKKAEEKKKEADEALRAYEEEEAAKNAEDDVNLDEALDKIISDGDIILEQPQVDIIVFNTYEKFNEFALNNKLVALDEYLKLSSKQLKSYIYPELLEAVKLDGEETFGIPVNGRIGTYEYLVFDKQLVEKYKFDVSKVTSMADLEKFLKAVKNEPGVVPMEKAVLPVGFEFYPRGGSAVGVYRGTERDNLPDKVVYTYEDEELINHYKLINRFRKAGYLGSEDDPEGTRYAVQVRSGNETDIAKWEEEDGREYICVAYNQPILTNENALTGVFGISAKSTNKNKAMQLITLFNTNSELANLLQWGVENVHYYVVDEDDGMGTISLVADSGYVMNNNFTGNKYIKYRLEGEPDTFEADKEHNLNAMLVGAFGGFDPRLSAEDEEIFNNSLAVTDKYYDMLIGGYGNVNEIIESVKEEVKDLYSVSTFERFITSKFGGPYYLHALGIEERNAKPEEVVEGEETETTDEATAEAE